MPIPFSCIPAPGGCEFPPNNQNLCLHWLPALWLSELALPVCMESLKSMRIYVLLPQSLSYAWLVERTNTLASLELSWLDSCGMWLCTTFTAFPVSLSSVSILLLDLLLFLVPLPWWFSKTVPPAKSLSHKFLSQALCLGTQPKPPFLYTVCNLIRNLWLLHIYWTASGTKHWTRGGNRVDQRGIVPDFRSLYLSREIDFKVQWRL